MFIRTLFAILTISPVTLSVHAKQPISESLIDCAALFTISTRAFPERESAKSRALRNAALKLADAANERAASEGRVKPDEYVRNLLREKQTKWDGRGVDFIFSEEFRDWASYCRSLSKHLGLSLKPPKM